MKFIFTLILFFIGFNAFSSDVIFDKNQTNNKMQPIFDMSLETNVYSNYGVDFALRYKLNNFLNVGALSGFQVERYNEDNEFRPVFDYDKTGYHIPAFIYARFGYLRLSLQTQLGYHFSTRPGYSGFTIGGRFYFSNCYFENIIVFSDKEETIFSIGFQFNNIFDK